MPQSQTMLHHACPRCGSGLRYTGGRNKLECGKCGYNRVLGRHSDQVDHHPLKAGVKLKKFDRGLDGNFKSMTCGGCETTFAHDADQPPGRCPYCHSEELEESSRHNEVITPSGLIPFMVSRQTAQAQLAAELNSWFLAEGLRKLLQPDEMQGVYMPYFLYDALTRSSWRAESGFRVVKLIKDTPVDQLSWESTGGYYEHFFEGVSIPFTMGIDDLEGILPFDLGQLVPYDPRFLKSFTTELYQVDEVATFGQADAMMSDSIKEEVLKRAPGKEQRAMKITSEKFALGFRHVLVPVWIGVFHYRGEMFQYLINGQTGEMVGEHPLSTPRMLAAVGGGVGVLTLLTLLLG